MARTIIGQRLGLPYNKLYLEILCRRIYYKNVPRFTESTNTNKMAVSMK